MVHTVYEFCLMLILTWNVVNKLRDHGGILCRHDTKIYYVSKFKYRFEARVSNLHILKR